MKGGSELYLCLCLSTFHVQTLIRYRQELTDRPLAIIDLNSPIKTIIDLNNAASALGLSIGMSSVQASLDSTLVLLPPSPSEEAMAKDDLIHACSQVTPLIEDCSHGNQCILVLAIASSITLFGGPEQLTAHLLSSIASMGFQASTAISHNFYTSMLLAKSQDRDPQIHVPARQERNYLSHLSISCLSLDFYQHETFANWGIRTLGNIASLPLTELVSRMGRPATRLHQLATGTCPHIFQPLQIPAIYKDSLCFDIPVDLVESLLFSVAAMLERLILRALEEMKSIASLTLSMNLSDQSIHVRQIRPAIPSTNSRLLLKLTHLDLDAHPPMFGVLQLSLTATLGLAQHAQLGIFSPQHPDASQLHITLARIRKLVGADHAGSPVVEDSHRQCAFELKAFTAIAPCISDDKSRPHFIAKRSFKLPSNVMVKVMNKLPISFFLNGSLYQIEQSCGPWRSTGKWWNSQRWNIDQWDVIARNTETDSALACCLSLNRETGCWGLDGIYD